MTVLSHLAFLGETTKSRNDKTKKTKIPQTDIQVGDCSTSASFPWGGGLPNPQKGNLETTKQKKTKILRIDLQMTAPPLLAFLRKTTKSRNDKTDENPSN